VVVDGRQHLTNRAININLSHLKFQLIDAAYRRKFTITNDKLQMIGMGFAHDFNYFRRKYLNL